MQSIVGVVVHIVLMSFYFYDELYVSVSPLQHQFVCQDVVSVSNTIVL